MNREKKRHYGWFKCSRCGKHWESSHVYYEDFEVRWCSVVVPISARYHSCMD